MCSQNLYLFGRRRAVLGRGKGGGFRRTSPRSTVAGHAGMPPEMKKQAALLFHFARLHYLCQHYGKTISNRLWAETYRGGSDRPGTDYPRWPHNGGYGGTSHLPPRLSGARGGRYYRGGMAAADGWYSFRKRTTCGGLHRAVAAYVSRDGYRSMGRALHLCLGPPHDARRRAAARAAARQSAGGRNQCHHYLAVVYGTTKIKGEGISPRGTCPLSVGRNENYQEQR